MALVGLGCGTGGSGVARVGSGVTLVGLGWGSGGARVELNSIEATIVSCLGNPATVRTLVVSGPNPNTGGRRQETWQP